MITDVIIKYKVEKKVVANHFLYVERLHLDFSFSRLRLFTHEHVYVLNTYLFFIKILIIDMTYQTLVKELLTKLEQSI